MILNLFYKEWIKTRWILFLALMVGLCTVFYIFTSVHHRMIMLGAKSYILKMLYDDPPIIYYSLLKYIPVLAAIAVGLAQYMPEMSKKRYRLLLHLPVNREFAIFSMALYGMIALTLFNLIILGYFVWTNTKIFPTEVTLPVLGSIIPWFLGSYFIYNFIALIALEPHWKRRIIYLLMTCLLIEFFLVNVGYHGAYASSWSVLLVMIVFSVPLLLYSYSRFKTSR